ncbi:MAG TPA: UDP-glucose 4-epimerase GalE, partial [Candidatus Nitrosotenuis sp.]|nr:UDP-glucose 4-epimerase GalE [Candidatus Nitrosotenuis sp.]
MRLLITGGAGFIGGHVAHLLTQKGVDIAIYDNLSTGKKHNLVKDVPFYPGDLANSEYLYTCLAQGKFDGVIHLASSIDPVESLLNPKKYYHNNTVNTLTLLECCQKAGIHHIIYSSTAAVYGLSKQIVVDETAPLAPLSPYGMSKVMSENIIKDFATAYGMKYVILRYFNVVGVDPQYNVGYADSSKNLIKIACEVALGKQPYLPIYGNTYSTKDGTTIRDYIHPTDLALAHFLASDYLIQKQGDNITLNCGYGQGYSVLDVVR